MSQLYHTKGGIAITPPVKAIDIVNLPETRYVDLRVGRKHEFNLPLKQYRNIETLTAMAERVNDAVNMTSRNEFDAEGFAQFWPKEWGTMSTAEIDILRAKGILSSRPKTLAYSVRMDRAAEFYLAMHDWAASRYPLRKQVPNMINFLAANFDELAASSVAMSAAMEKVFEVKSFYLVARPEEVLRNNMTLYTEGCPCHGEAGSGHTTAAFVIVMELRKRFAIDRKGMLHLFRTAWYIANARTLAGVHYYDTNYLTVKWVIEKLYGETFASVLEAPNV